MTSIRIKLPTINDVTFGFRVKQDEDEIKGNVFDSDDLEEDRKAEEEIIRRIDNGDVWAWCYIVVRAQWRGIYGADSLGHCSYSGVNEFKADKYKTYEEMKINAFENLIEKIKELTK